MTTTTTGYYSTDEVAVLTGLSFRQLDYWSRCGAIWPEIGARGSGTHRQWSEQQTEWLMKIGEAYRQAERRGLVFSVVAVGHIWTALAAGEDWEVSLWVG